MGRVPYRLFDFIPVGSLLVGGCLSIPLPDSGPDRMEEWPSPGMSVDEVSDRLGDADLLATPRHCIYEWSTDRSFVVAVMPLGVPVAGVFGGGRYRALVTFDETGRVEDVEVLQLDRRERRGVRLESCYRLPSLPELAQVDLVLETGGTATFSLDGDFLAVTDDRNRVWVVDVEAREAVLAHEGRRGSLLSLSPPGPVRTAFSPSGDELAVAQHRGPSAIVTRDDRGCFGAPAVVGEGDLVAAAFAPDGTPLFLDREGGVRIQGAPGSSAPGVVSVDLALKRRGVVMGRPEGSTLVAARVEGRWLQPAQVVVLEAAGRGLAVLDPRRAATGWGPPGLAVSPSGSWLAHNSGRHVELWRCTDLVAGMDGATVDTLAAAVFVLGPAHLDEDWLEPAAAIAFDRGSRWVAAATATGIDVWRLRDGERVASIGPLPLEFDRNPEHSPGASGSALRVHRLALAADGRLTALLHDFAGLPFLATWRLDDATAVPRAEPWKRAGPGGLASGDDPVLACPGD